MTTAGNLITITHCQMNLSVRTTVNFMNSEWYRTWDIKYLFTLFVKLKFYQYIWQVIKTNKLCKNSPLYRKATTAGLMAAFVSLSERELILSIASQESNSIANTKYLFIKGARVSCRGMDGIIPAWHNSRWHPDITSLGWALASRGCALTNINRALANISRALTNISRAMANISRAL